MNDKIRVLYYHPYPHFNTGSPKALANLIDSLDRSVFQPVYLATEDGAIIHAMEERGAEIVSGLTSSVSLSRPITAAAAIWKRAAELRKWRIDLVHANGVFWNTDLLLAAGLLRIPVILHVHNPEIIHFRNLNRFAANRVLVCSRSLINDCPGFDRVTRKAAVLHNAVDTETFGRGTPIRDALGLSRSDIAIGTVAQISERKGIDTLLETARLLSDERPELVFLIAGPVGVREEDYARSMAAVAAARDFGGRVRFLGSRSDIPDFLASVDLFAFPTRAEPFGIAVIEAMAAKLPVIASKVGGIPEIICASNIGRLVDPVTPTEFANAIREVLARPDHGRVMGEAARLSVLERFSLARVGERLNEIYMNLVG